MAILAPFPERFARWRMPRAAWRHSLRRLGFSRETLYRTLSANGNPRLDTLALILAAFGLRLAVQPAAKTKTRIRRSESRART